MSEFIGPDGQIKVAVKTVTGLPRFLRPTETEIPGEVLVVWNHAGVGGPPGPQGDAGHAGPAGFQGETGPRGGTGFTGYEIVQGNELRVDVPPNSDQGFNVVAQAPPGKIVISGGFKAKVITDSFEGPASSLYLTHSFPADDGSAWVIQVVVNQPVRRVVSVTAYAICING